MKTKNKIAFFCILPLSILLYNLLLFLIFKPYFLIEKAVNLIKEEQYEDAISVLYKINTEESFTLINVIDGFKELNNKDYDKACMIFRPKVCVIINYEANGGVTTGETIKSEAFGIEYKVFYKGNEEFLGYELIDYKYEYERIYITLKVLYSPPKFYISYILTGDVNNSLNTITTFYENDPNIKIYPPTRPGYRFLGWKIDNSDEIYNDVIIDTTELKDTTLTPVWEAIKYVLTFIYDYGNTTIKQVVTINYGDKINYPPIIKEGYELLFWDYNGEKFQAEYYKFGTDITIVARWIKSKTK